MLKIAIYTLTRDRLDYTKHCLQSLKDKAGVEYDHYVFDNGSKDGTQDWLHENVEDFALVETSNENQGISKASNRALDKILEKDYDLIIKMDNDCEIVSDNLLGQIVEIYEGLGDFAPQYILSPRVEGINRQPARERYEQLAGRRVGITGIVGGLFHIVPAKVYKEYRYPEELPKAFGQDQHFCNWAKINGCVVGYIEGLVVNHFETTDGQAKKYPEYFERKWQEEK